MTPIHPSPNLTISPSRSWVQIFIFVGRATEHVTMVSCVVDLVVIPFAPCAMTWLIPAIEGIAACGRLHWLATPPTAHLHVLGAPLHTISWVPALSLHCFVVPTPRCIAFPLTTPSGPPPPARQFITWRKTGTGCGQPQKRIGKQDIWPQKGCALGRRGWHSPGGPSFTGNILTGDGVGDKQGVGGGGKCERSLNYGLLQYLAAVEKSQTCSLIHCTSTSFALWTRGLKNDKNEQSSCVIRSARCQSIPCVTRPRPSRMDQRKWLQVRLLHTGIQLECHSGWQFSLDIRRDGVRITSSALGTSELSQPNFVKKFLLALITFRHEVNCWLCGFYVRNFASFLHPSQSDFGTCLWFVLLLSVVLFLSKEKQTLKLEPHAYQEIFSTVFRFSKCGASDEGTASHEKAHVSTLYGSLCIERSHLSWSDDKKIQLSWNKSFLAPSALDMRPSFTGNHQKKEHWEPSCLLGNRDGASSRFRHEWKSILGVKACFWKTCE